MLDLETWGTGPGCAVRSIGAVMFDPRTDFISQDTFYRNILDASCESVGLVRESGTVRWWSEQSQEAQDSLKSDQRQLVDVVVDFQRWWHAQAGEQLWSQGANFDGPIWERACAAVQRRAPWKFYNTRDTRTAYEMGGLDTRTISRQGTYHNALDDAIHQAKCVQIAHARLRA
jgi:exodeoxyribonuclease VIII